MPVLPSFAQTPSEQPTPDSEFRISLPVHPGRLQWRADGFRIIEASAKAKGQEIGLRGEDGQGRLTFLGFLFLVPEQAPLSSAKCRDGALQEQRNNPTLKFLAISEREDSENIPVALATYSERGQNGKLTYRVRGFVATGDVCGDLGSYSDFAISAEDARLKEIFDSYHLDPNYVPQFKEVLLFAQILFKRQMYGAAAPYFEQALSTLGDDKTQQAMRRVLVDQAGMSYGMSGDIAKARAIFEAAIAKDPDYPMYYYNLACADAEEHRLAEARIHLRDAFARKANMITGEKLPDPTKDDSFLPYKGNKDFWSFLQGLH